MGHSKIIPLIIRESRTKTFVAAYDKKYAGKPNNENLSKWRDKFNQSLSKGGCNEHLGIKYWLQTDIEIYSQIKGEIVATFKAPMFEVIN